MRRLIALAAVVAIIAPYCANGDAGEQLFQQGVGATALVADGAVRVAATSFACASCHGDDASGGREGGTVFPPLVLNGEPVHTLSELTAALFEGRASDGRKLTSSMPRYEAEPSTLEALHAYLGRLADTSRVGVLSRSLEISPLSDPLLRPAFVLAIQQANARGGAWGREFRLTSSTEVLVVGDEAIQKVRNAADLYIVEEIAVRLQQPKLALGPGVDHLAMPLSRYGIEADPHAAQRLEYSEGGAWLVDNNGEKFLITPPGLASADQTLSTYDALAFFVGQEITDAAIACGRNITRRCVLERIGVGINLR